MPWMVMSIFCFRPEVYFFLGKLLRNIIIVFWSWNLETRLMWIWSNQWFSFFFLFKIGNTLFGLICCENLELSVKIWYLDYLEYGNLFVNFFLFRPFFCKFCPKNPFRILILPDLTSSSLLAETWSQWLLLFYVQKLSLNSSELTQRTFHFYTPWIRGFTPTFIVTVKKIRNQLIFLNKTSQWNLCLIPTIPMQLWGI